MAKEIVWTKRALSKFNKIIDYLESEWGENTTSRFVKRTYDIIELISELPDLGTLENQEKKSEDFL